MAWITEQKNTLSALFYLAAMLVYLRFDQERKTRLYCWALALFVLGLLSKTTAATAAAGPAGDLLVAARPGLAWGRDIRPLRFFALGLLAGLFHGGGWRRTADGAQADGLRAFHRRGQAGWRGRAIWFSVGKLFWPTELASSTPLANRQAAGWQYVAARLYILAGIVGGPAAVARPPRPVRCSSSARCCPCGMVERVSVSVLFVADHFQYLASFGEDPSPPVGRTVKTSGRIATCFVLLGALATFTWRQSRIYSDAASCPQRPSTRIPVL